MAKEKQQVDISESLKVKFNMSDKFDDKRTYFEYFTKSLNSKGNYIHNKNDKVKSLNKIK